MTMVRVVVGALAGFAVFVALYNLVSGEAGAGAISYLVVFGLVLLWAVRGSRPQLARTPPNCSACKDSRGRMGIVNETRYDWIPCGVCNSEGGYRPL